MTKYIVFNLNNGECVPIIADENSVKKNYEFLDKVPLTNDLIEIKIKYGGYNILYTNRPDYEGYIFDECETFIDICSVSLKRKKCTEYYAFGNSLKTEIEKLFKVKYFDCGYKYQNAAHELPFLKEEVYSYKNKSVLVFEHGTSKYCGRIYISSK